MLCLFHLLHLGGISRPAAWTSLSDLAGHSIPDPILDRTTFGCILLQNLLKKHTGISCYLPPPPKPLSVPPFSRASSLQGARSRSLLLGQPTQPAPGPAHRLRLASCTGPSSIHWIHLLNPTPHKRHQRYKRYFDLTSHVHCSVSESGERQSAVSQQSGDKLKDELM